MGTQNEARNVYFTGCILSGDGSERMMMVHLPSHRLLYASDMVQRMPDGSFFMPQYPSEVIDAVRQEGITVGRNPCGRADAVAGILNRISTWIVKPGMEF